MLEMKVRGNSAKSRERIIKTLQIIIIIIVIIIIFIIIIIIIISIDKKILSRQAVK